MSKQIPPVPPNCDWFFWYSPLKELTRCTFGGNTYRLQSTPCAQEPNADAKKIIACVAAQYWRMEAKKWANTPVNDCKHFDDIATWKAEAEANAVAWLKWGGLE